MAIHPFTVAIPQADLDDLNHRLARTRWTNELPGVGGVYGVSLDYVRRLVACWQDGYDWRTWEARLNAYPQFITEIDGQSIHFLHVRSPEPDATPLILTHGWPSSCVEYLDLIEPLVNPRQHGGEAADAFHVVIPDMPGFAFSGPTTEPGWTIFRVAAAWVELMRRLGYERYGAHGNDGGSQVSPEMGRIAPEQVIGVHVTQLFSFPSGDPAEFEGLTPDEMEYLQFLQQFVGHSIHDKAQQAQPQTLAHALADSPAGQLAWIGQLLAGIPDPDVILTIATIYWLTNTAASSARFYYEEAHAPKPEEPSTFPIGLASFAFDFRPLRRFAERDHKNIVSWNEYDRGGHWSAHDAPDLLLDDIRGFFRRFR